jgi:hypothetical protein
VSPLDGVNEAVPLLARRVVGELPLAHMDAAVVTLSHGYPAMHPKTSMVAMLGSVIREAGRRSAGMTAMIEIENRDSCTGRVKTCGLIRSFLTPMWKRLPTFPMRLLALLRNR